MHTLSYCYGLCINGCTMLCPLNLRLSCDSHAVYAQNEKAIFRSTEETIEEKGGVRNLILILA